MVPGSVGLAGFNRLAEQLPAGNGGKGTGQMVLACPIGIGAGTLAQHQIIQLDILLDGTGGANPDDVLHAVAIEQLMGVNTNGRHTHAGGHDGHPDALIGAGIALDAPNIVHQHRIFQKVFRNEFAAQGVTGHQHSLSKIAGFGGNMRGRGCEHCSISFLNSCRRWRQLRFSPWPWPA